MEEKKNLHLITDGADTSISPGRHDSPSSRDAAPDFCSIEDASGPPLRAPFTVVIDGREKAPYQFFGLHADARSARRPLIVPTEWCHLKAGDYSIKGHEHEVAIERKSIEDLYSTLGSHRDRFEIELQKLAVMDFAAVVIEASWTEILTTPPAPSRLNPKAVHRTALAWMVKYGVVWITADSRRLAEITTFRLLEKWWRNHGR